MNALVRTTRAAAWAVLVGCLPGGCQNDKDNDKVQAVADQTRPAPRVSGAPVVPGEPTLRLDHGPEDRPRAVFLVEGLGQADLERLAKLDTDGLSALFVIQVAEGPQDLPPLLGSHEVKDGALRFEPRFPLQPGKRYRATFDPARLPDSQPATGPITTEFVAAKALDTPPTRIDHVYPTRDVLPENQLKLYVHFSAPMARGESYSHIQLINEASKKVIDLPFLEIAEELWADRQTRLTLLFDPARVKRGLASREEAGPILEEGQSYTLMIDRAWPDSTGKPLASTFRKTFRAGPPDDQPIDVAAWAVEPPKSGGTAPLVVAFPEPLDHAMLRRAMTVRGPDQFPIRGTIAIDREETRWRFTPESAWKAGEHELVVDAELEDLAGNSVGRPFEIDVFQKVQKKVQTETVRKTFVVE